LAGTVFPDILYEPKKPHKIDIEVAVPKEVKAGSVYSLHIAQCISHTVTGGYTVVIIVK
jgi:hypothetical protein